MDRGSGYKREGAVGGNRALDEEGEIPRGIICLEISNWSLPPAPSVGMPIGYITSVHRAKLSTLTEWGRLVECALITITETQTGENPFTSLSFQKKH